MSLHLIAEIGIENIKPEITRVFLHGEDGASICRDGRPVSYVTVLSVSHQATRQEEIDILCERLHKTREYHWIIPFLSPNDKKLLARKPA